MKNPDLIAGISSEKIVKVGFAAETESLVENAKSKLVSKDLDLIVANDITASDAGFASDDNRVIILDREGGIDRLPLMSKYDVGVEVLNRLSAAVQRSRGFDVRLELSIDLFADTTTLVLESFYSNPSFKE